VLLLSVLQVLVLVLLRHPVQQMEVELHKLLVREYQEHGIDQRPYSLLGITEKRQPDLHKLF
jgi:hypothetical protein